MGSGALCWVGRWVGGQAEQAPVLLCSKQLPLAGLACAVLICCVAWPLATLFTLQIGEGSFGKVFLAKWRETTVAVKVLGNLGAGGSSLDDEFPDAAAAKGHPLYESLQKVGGWGDLP